MSDQEKSVSAERVCENILGLSHARGKIAEKIAGAWQASYAPREASGDSLLDLDLPRVPFWVIDVETTGQGPLQDRIIEIAGVEVHGLSRCRHFSALVNPGVALPEFIVRLTGITNAMLASAPGPEEIMPFVRGLLCGSAFVGHSASFDWRFVKSELTLLPEPFPEPPVICTVRLARRLRPDLKNHNLDTLARAFRLRFAEEGSSRARHRALGDAEITASLFIRFLRLVQPLGIRTVRDLKKFQSLPLKKAQSLIKSG